MLEAHFRTKSGQLSFKLTGETVKVIFEELAEVQEIFDVSPVCGVCENSDIAYRVRENGGNKFYELHCLTPACRARFSFGQSKDQKSLFPKRKDSEGNWIDNDGWVKYRPEH
jgi:hypothetical protein